MQLKNVRVLSKKLIFDRFPSRFPVTSSIFCEQCLWVRGENDSLLMGLHHKGWQNRSKNTLQKDQTSKKVQYVNLRRSITTTQIVNRISEETEKELPGSEGRLWRMIVRRGKPLGRKEACRVIFIFRNNYQIWQVLNKWHIIWRNKTSPMKWQEGNKCIFCNLKWDETSQNCKSR